MVRKILSYGFIEGIAKGLNKLILLLLPFFLETTDFGKVGLILSIETLLPILTLLGFERVILRFYSVKNDFQNFDKTLNVAINYSHLVVLLFFIVLYFTGIKSFLGLQVFPDLILLVALVYLQGTNLITLNKFRVSEQHQSYFKSRLFLQIGKFLFVLLLVFLTKSYVGYLVGGIVIALITNIIFRTTSDGLNNQKFDKKTFTFLFAFSWPFIFHGISMNLLGNADKFIIEKFLTLSDVGLYTFAYSIGSMVVFAYIGISIYMEPLIYKSKNDIQKEKLLSRFVLFSLGAGLFLFFIISVTTIYILPKVYDKNYLSVLKYIPFIALSHLLFPFYLSANYRMIYEKKTIRMACASVIACAVNIALNFWLIPIYGIYAAVLITLISYFIQAIGFIFVSNNFKFTFELVNVLVLACIIFVGIVYELAYYYLFLLVTLYLGYFVRFQNFNMKNYE